MGNFFAGKMKALLRKCEQRGIKSRVAESLPLLEVQKAKKGTTSKRKGGSIRNLTKFGAEPEDCEYCCLSAPEV